MDNTVIITGGSRGIGRAIALDLAESGYNIAFTFHQNTDAAQELEAVLNDKGIQAKAYRVDIRDFDAVAQIKERIFADFENITALINNAGITADAPLSMMPVEKWNDVIFTNLNGVFNFSRQVIMDFMKQKEGNIINISSVSGLTGPAGQTNYAASKGGINAFTKSLAKEAAPFNVRVNAVAPGFIESDMTGSMEEEMKARFEKLIPMRRFGQAQEVAGVVRFILSKEASYITGEIIQVNGGYGS